MNVVVSIDKMDSSFAKLVDTLSAVANVTVVGLDGFDLTDTDVFVGKKLGAAELNRANRLKVVFTYKTGIDEFALDKLKEMNVTLCNSHVNSDYIAQYALLWRWR